MSNPDSFIDEVTEEVRRDRLFAIFRRYGWIAVLVVILIVGGAAYSEWTKAKAAAKARAFGDALLAALESPDDAARLSALAAIPAESGTAAVLKLLTSAEAVRADDVPAAMAALDAIASDGTLPQSYRDLALLKKVMLAGAAMPATDRLAALETLITPGRPFRTLAMEQKAMIQIETGERDAGLALLRDVLKEPQATQGLRSRVSQVMVALGAPAETE